MRPVKCCFCGSQMYYKGDPKWVNEASIEITTDRYEETEQFEHHYVHKSCLDKLKESWKDKIGAITDDIDT